MADPIVDVLRAHDAGLVLVTGSLECSGHVLLPWFAHAALRGPNNKNGEAASSALVVLAAAHPPSAHAAALRKVQQQQVPQQQHRAPIPVIYVEPCFPGPDEDDGGEESGGGGWLGRLSRDLAAAVRRQADAAAAAAAASEGIGRPHPPLPAQITVLVDSLTALAAAADAGAAADAAPSAASAVCAPRLPRAHRDWLAFLHSLVSLEARCPAARVRVVTLCADDVPSDAGWRRWLRHRCAALLSLAPVEGRTAGLDGELRAEARAAPAGGRGAQETAGVLFAPGAVAAAAAGRRGGGGWRGGGGGGGVGGSGGGWAAAADGWGAGRCFFRASELSLRWVSDVQSADLMR